MIDLKPACRQMIDLVTAITDDHLTSPTPCTEYTLGDLIEHIDEVSQGSIAVARKDSSGQTISVSSLTLAPDLAGGQRNNVANHVQALGEAWDDPEAWQGSTDAGGVELSNDLWGKIALTEMVVHGWDIAQSIGRPFHLPEDTLKACLDHVAEFVPRAPVPGLWGPAVEVPADASLLDHIVAVTGRTP